MPPSAARTCFGAGAIDAVACCGVTGVVTALVDVGSESAGDAVTTGCAAAERMGAEELP